MTRSLTKELFIPFKDLERQFRSSRKHFKTLSLDGSRSPDFDLFSDREEYSKEEVAETMAKTMEQYMSKTRADYGSRVARPNIKDNNSFELKGQFLKELRDNTFSDSDHEDANKHIKKVLKIVDLFHIPNITIDQVMLRAFHMSRIRAASRWLRNKPSGSITTWEDLKTKFLSKYCPPDHTTKKMEEINNLHQEPDENLYQAWDQFKELLMKCPQHYFDKNAGDSLPSNKWLNTVKNGTMEHQGPEDVNNVKVPTTPKIAQSRKKGKPSKKLTTLNLVHLFKEGDIEQQLQDSTKGTTLLAPYISLRDKDLQDSKDLQVKMRIEQYFLMPDYSLWEVILNGDSPLPTRFVDGVVQPVAPATAEQRLVRKNELKAQSTLLMALPDKHQLKFNIHKDAKTLMEAIEKRFGRNKETNKVQKTLLKQQYEKFTGSSSESLDQIHDRLQKLISQLEILGDTLSQEDINLKFLRSLPTEWRTHTLIWRNKTYLEEQSLDDLFNSLKMYKNEMAMLIMRARRFLQRTGRNLEANGTTSIRFDMSKVKCYNYHRRGHFARECRSPKDTRRNVLIETQRRNVLVETQRRNVEEEPTNYVLMAFTSSSSSSSDNEVASYSKAYTKAYATLQSHYDKLTNNLQKSQFDVISYKIGLESVEARLLVYQKNETIFEEDIKVLKLDVMLRDNDLVELRKKFEKAEYERDNDEFISSDSDVSMPSSPVYNRYQSGEGYHVVPSPYTGTFMPHKPDLIFHDAPTVNETVLTTLPVEPKDESEGEPKHTQTAPSFVQPIKHVKTPRPSVKPVKHPTPDINLRKDIPKTRGHRHSRNIKACFVCKSLTYLIKDLLTKSRLVPLTATRLVTTAVPQPHVTRLRLAKNVVTKPNSPPRRTINIRPSPSHSNFPNKVTNAKASKVNAVKGNISYLSNFEAINGGYVAFGGNLKGGKITSKGEGGTIEEEVYVCQPLGFEDPDYPDKVYKVVKELYGLHQAPRAWYETLANYLLENGFQRRKIDHTLFIKRQKGDILLVQKNDGIFISQDKYVAEILKKFGLTDEKSASTPIDTEKPLLKDPDSKDVDVHTYRSIIGSLIYLTSSRPDIMFTVCACARFQVTQKVLHLHAVKRIFSNYTGASLDRKSTTGGCQFLGCRLISWQCKKQTVVATSLTKAEYVAAASYCAQLLRIQNQLLDYGGEIAELDADEDFTLEEVAAEVLKDDEIQGRQEESQVHVYHIDLKHADKVLSMHDDEPDPGDVIEQVKRKEKQDNSVLRYQALKRKPQTEAQARKNMMVYLKNMAGFKMDFFKVTMLELALIGSPQQEAIFNTVSLKLLLFGLTIDVAQLLLLGHKTFVSIKKLNDVVRLQALTYRKKMIITKDSIRQALLLDDVDSVDCLPNKEIFTELARIGYEKPSTKLTFYKAFFLAQWNLVRNVDSPFKFYMYPRFLQLMINAQVGDLSSHTTKYTSPALTQKVFANTRRVRKGFSGVDTPLFADMLVPQQAQDVEDAAEDEDNVNETFDTLTKQVANLEQDKIAQAIEITKLKQRVNHLEKKRQFKSLGLKRLRKEEIAELDADKDVTLEEVDAEVTKDADVQGRLEESQAKVYHLDLKHADKVLSMQETDEAEPAKVEEVIEVVIAAKLMTDVVTIAAATPIIFASVPKASAPRRIRGAIIQDPKKATTALVSVQSENEVVDQVKRKERQDNTIMRYQALKRKPVTEAHARKNMMVYLKNMARFKMNFFRGMTYTKIRPIFEKHYNLNQAFLERVEEEVTGQEKEVSKRKSKSSKQRATKKQKINEEVKELKTHLQIIPNDEDDVYTEATPLALKVLVVDYQIHHEHNKPFYKIISADGTHQLFLSFITLLMNFDREDLEIPWKLVQERFQSLEPKNFSDDFLLNTFKIMFEKPNVEASIWRDQRGRYGLAKVKSWKLFESCGVHIITFTTTQMILLVKRKYPLTRFTLEQMLNNVRLEVKEESEVSLELLRLMRRQQQEGYKPE
uniref:Reverse transcriptase Ty1/copia-type domain-containing protein n=1 Tax=Tanacetum cinerariifolium TaxID=118510 RepID=A0A6L2JC54_TANCI|nr:hypothetical protein [Tanacetum cinerariifolium]